MLTDLATGRRLDVVADCQPVPGLLPPMISLEVDPAGFRESQQERLAGKVCPASTSAMVARFSGILRRSVPGSIPSA